MPIYMMQGSYTTEAVREFLQNPEERGTATIKLVESVGGTVLGFYYCIGKDDFVLITELPDDESALTCTLVGTSPGIIKNYKTSKLFTLEQAKAFMARAGKIVAASSPQS